MPRKNQPAEPTEDGSAVQESKRIKQTAPLMDFSQLTQEVAEVQSTKGSRGSVLDDAPYFMDWMQVAIDSKDENGEWLWRQTEVPELGGEGVDPNAAVKQFETLLRAAADRLGMAVKVRKYAAPRPGWTIVRYRADEKTTRPRKPKDEMVSENQDQASE
jgi:hypothetical protein